MSGEFTIVSAKKRNAKAMLKANAVSNRVVGKQIVITQLGINLPMIFFTETEKIITSSVETITKTGKTYCVWTKNTRYLMR